jgi:hypothetical protein
MTANLTEDRRKIRIVYNDESICMIKPVAWIKLDDVADLQKELLSQYIESKGAIGAFFRKKNRKAWSLIKQLIKLLPTVDDIPLDVEKIHDFEDLKHIFITTTDATTEVTGWTTPESGSLSPSYISVIHGLDFFEILGEMIEERHKAVSEMNA